MLSLNTKNVVQRATTVYVGNVSASLVRIGELFRDAVRLDAAGIVLVHNHPSGDPTPSPDDLHLTAEAIAAGRLLDVDVLDHVVIGHDAWVSLRDRGVAFDRAVAAVPRGRPDRANPRGPLVDLRRIRDSRGRSHGGAVVLPFPAGRFAGPLARRCRCLSSGRPSSVDGPNRDRRPTAHEGSDHDHADHGQPRIRAGAIRRSPVSRCSRSCSAGLHGPRRRRPSRPPRRPTPTPAPTATPLPGTPLPEAYRPEGDWAVTFALPGDFIRETWRIVLTCPKGACDAIVEIRDAKGKARGPGRARAPGRALRPADRPRPRPSTAPPPARRSRAARPPHRDGRRARHLPPRRDGDRPADDPGPPDGHARAQSGSPAARRRPSSTPPPGNRPSRSRPPARYWPRGRERAGAGQ